MTSSFTTTEQFGTQIGADFGDEKQYPEAFGITFTPQITGILIGVAGLLGAGYLYWTYVRPVWTELSTLQTQKAEKETQLTQLNNSELQVKLKQKQGELEQAQQIKKEVINLYANEESLESLLLDVSNFANLTNLRLNSYAPQPDKEKVADDSFGTLAQNNLQIKTYNLDLEGTFTQLQLFLQDLERLQPLMVVQNFNANADPQNYVLNNNQLVAVGQPKLKSTITVKAVFPDLQPIAPPASEQPAGEQPAGEQPQ